MGIRFLNRFLRDHCNKKSIRKIHLKHFANKTIVVDTSIYMYKFIGDNALMENMYLLISILKSYRITPIFIFDGKPPPEKKELLNKRRMEKKEAEQKYLNLKATMSNSGEDTTDIIAEMENLRRQFLRIRDEDIRKTKELMDAYGVCYYDSKSEADEVCAYLVKTGKAYACLSDDMDMFLYSCPYVMRHLSIMNHTIILYDTSAILKDLEMSERHFCEIMVLSGTDYNINSNASLNETLRWYKEYKKYCVGQIEKEEFYVWLVNHTNYVSDYNSLQQIYNMFQIDNNSNLKEWDNLENINKEVDMNKLKNIMKTEGFLFC